MFAVAWAMLDVANFREIVKAEVRFLRIRLPRTPVNKGRLPQGCEDLSCSQEGPAGQDHPS